MSITYTKVEDATEESIESLPLTKCRLFTTDGDGVSETPWFKKMSDGRLVMVNHAINFHPFPSWGVVFPAVEEREGEMPEIDITKMREGDSLPLHPEAYANYEEQNMIDADGKYTPPKQAADPKGNEAE